MANSVITKADIQNYAPELDLSQYSDATISGMCSQATERAAGYCGVTGFDFTQTVDEMERARISTDGELMIAPRRKPIVSVSAVSLVKGGFSTDITLTQGNTPLYQIPYPQNMIVIPNSYLYATGSYMAGGASQLLSLRGANLFYKMTYYAGYQIIPDDLKYAVTLYVRDIVSKRSNPTGLKSFTQGSYSETNSVNDGGKSKLVLEAEGVLNNGGFVRSEM